MVLNFNGYSLPEFEGWGHLNDSKNNASSAPSIYLRIERGIITARTSPCADVLKTIALNTAKLSIDPQTRRISVNDLIKFVAPSWYEFQCWSTILDENRGWNINHFYRLYPKKGSGSERKGVRISDQREVSLIEHNRPEVGVRNAVNITEHLRGHPAVCVPVDILENEKAFTVVLPRLAGNMEQRVSKSGGIEEKDARSYMFQILEALAFFHDRGIVHTTISPQNVRFVRDEEDNAEWDLVKITGWQNALFLNSEEKISRTRSQYAAPDKNLTPGVDVWAVGSLLYYMISGTVPPAKNSNDKGFFDRNKSGRWESISGNCMSVIRELLEQNSSNRITARKALGMKWFSPPPKWWSDAGNGRSSRKRNGKFSNFTKEIENFSIISGEEVVTETKERKNVKNTFKSYGSKIKEKVGGDLRKNESNSHILKDEESAKASKRSFLSSFSKDMNLEASTVLTGDSEDGDIREGLKNSAKKKLEKMNFLKEPKTNERKEHISEPAKNAQMSEDGDWDESSLTSTMVKNSSKTQEVKEGNGKKWTNFMGNAKEKQPNKSPSERTDENGERIKEERREWSHELEDENGSRLGDDGTNSSFFSKLKKDMKDKMKNMAEDTDPVDGNYSASKKKWTDEDGANIEQEESSNSRKWGDADKAMRNLEVKKSSKKTGKKKHVGDGRNGSTDEIRVDEEMNAGRKDRKNKGKKRKAKTRDAESQLPDTQKERATEESKSQDGGKKEVEGKKLTEKLRRIGGGFADKKYNELMQRSDRLLNR